MQFSKKVEGAINHVYVDLFALPEVKSNSHIG